MILDHYENNQKNSLFSVSNPCLMFSFNFYANIFFCFQLHYKKWMNELFNFFFKTCFIRAIHDFLISSSVLCYEIQFLDIIYFFDLGSHEGKQCEFATQFSNKICMKITYKLKPFLWLSFFLFQ